MRVQGRVCIQNVSTSNRRIIKQVKKRKKITERFTDPLPCEIDNHADTTCFGMNFRVTLFTSEVCSVSPFLAEYDSVADVPI